MKREMDGRWYGVLVGRYVSNLPSSCSSARYLCKEGYLLHGTVRYGTVRVCVMSLVPGVSQSPTKSTLGGGEMVDEWQEEEEREV